MENSQLISSDGLLHGDPVCVTKTPAHPINQITKENSNQVQHLAGCHYQEISAPEIRSLQNWKFLLTLFKEHEVILQRPPRCVSYLTTEQ